MLNSIFENTMMDMTWPEVEKAAKEGAVILLPVGVVEEHGPHMCLGVDAYLSVTQCKLTKEKLQQTGINALIAPPFYWGINIATGVFPGSFTSRHETVKNVILDILTSLKSWGFNEVFAINHHGDPAHCRAIMDGFMEAGNCLGIRASYLIPAGVLTRFNLTGKEKHILVIGRPNSASLSSAASSTPPKYLDIHAGAYETAAMRRYYPDWVDKELVKTLIPTNLGAEVLQAWAQGKIDARAVTPGGYFGDPAAFETTDGNYEGGAQRMADLIQSYLNGSYEAPENY